MSLTSLPMTRRRISQAMNMAISRSGSLNRWYECSKALFSGAYVLRRARWFLQLSESSLAWSPACISAPEKHLMVFEHGSVACCTALPLQESVPVPPGYRERSLDRLGHFDIMTFDRIRVVTTELRRLVSENRMIELRLNPAVTLNRNGLKKMLGWV